MNRYREAESFMPNRPPYHHEFQFCTNLRNAFCQKWAKYAHRDAESLFFVGLRQSDPKEPGLRLQLRA